MGRHTRAILAGLGLAGLLLAAGPAATAQADARAEARTKAGTVDVYVDMRFEDPQVAPGRQFLLYVSNWLQSGEASTFRTSVHLPKGLTAAAQQTTDCTATSADRREVSCGPHAQDLTVQVADDLAVGTKLTITATADIGDAVDTHPENNTDTQVVLVKPGADWSVKWTGPTAPVQPGSTPVTTKLVVTNHGAEAGKPLIITSGPADYPHQMELYGKWDSTCSTATEGNGLICLPKKSVPPGGSVTYTFRYTVFPAALGKEQRRQVVINPSHPASEPNIDDNTATLVVHVADKAAPPTGKPTPPVTTPPTGGTTPTHTPTTTSGDQLADTGADGTRPALIGAGAAVVIGGGLLLVSRRRRRNH